MPKIGRIWLARVPALRQWIVRRAMRPAVGGSQNHRTETHWVSPMCEIIAAGRAF